MGFASDQGRRAAPLHHAAAEAPPSCASASSGGSQAAAGYATCRHDRDACATKDLTSSSEGSLHPARGQSWRRRRRRPSPCGIAADPFAFSTCRFHREPRSSACRFAVRPAGPEHLPAGSSVGAAAPSPEHQSSQYSAPLCSAAPPWLCSPSAAAASGRHRRRHWPPPLPPAALYERRGSSERRGSREEAQEGRLPCLLAGRRHCGLPARRCARAGGRAGRRAAPRRRPQALPPPAARSSCPGGLQPAGCSGDRQQPGVHPPAGAVCGCGCAQAGEDS